MDITTLVNRVTTVIVNPLLILLFAAALLYFVWGVVRFLWALNTGGKDTKAGKQHMLWGLIGMFIMAAAAGILNLIEGTVNTFK